MGPTPPAWHSGGMRTADLNPIDGFLLALDRQLNGPARLKADLLTEARGGLEDAASAYEEGGLTAAEAGGRAVRDFGRLPELIPAYQAELVAVAGQRLAMWLGMVPLAISAASVFMWRGAPWVDVPPQPGYHLLSVGVDRLGAALTVGGLLAYVWFLLTARRGRPVSPATVRRLALAGLVGVGALSAAGLLVYAMTVARAPEALTWPPMVIGSVVNVLALGFLGRRAWRCAAWAALAG
jgi:hypothetical protein